MVPIPVEKNRSDFAGNATTANISAYDHITWYVSNAKQAASYYATRFGFSEIAYRGLETGSRDICSHVVRNGRTTIVFTSALRAQASLDGNHALVEAIHKHVSSHGDAVKDVSFTVDNVEVVYKAAITGGAEAVSEPQTLSDKFGTVRLATIKMKGGDTTHTLINRSKYPPNRFLPGFQPSERVKPFLDSVLGDTGIINIDHAVSNQGWYEMERVCDFYEQALGFHRFWSVDDTQVCTEFSALKSTVMASANEVIKMPVNEPAKGKKRSQIEEFVEFYNGPGVQHIALRTENIIETVTNLRQRGVEFIAAPATYYEALAKRLKDSPVNIKEDLKTIQDLAILVDFDNQGYLLQIFTKPLVDRPTVFIEVIQRENHNGFGAGNFKSLFEAIEQDQRLRGTL